MGQMKESPLTSISLGCATTNRNITIDMAIDAIVQWNKSQQTLQKINRAVVKCN
jgi:hypothetical protein